MCGSIYFLPGVGGSDSEIYRGLTIPATIAPPQAGESERRYNVSPENSSGQPDYWVLPEVIQMGKSLCANIHWKIKENHPVYLARNVTVQVSRVIYFRLFEREDSKLHRLVEKEPKIGGRVDREGNEFKFAWLNSALTGLH